MLRAIREIFQSIFCAGEDKRNEEPARRWGILTSRTETLKRNVVIVLFYNM